jgi:hypothetical protein
MVSHRHEKQSLWQDESWLPTVRVHPQGTSVVRDAPVSLALPSRSVKFMGSLPSFMFAVNQGRGL